MDTRPTSLTGTETTLQPRVFAREQLFLAAGLTALALAAWVYVLYGAWAMQHMDVVQMWMPPATLEPWGAGDFFMTFLMWAVMMVAMMVPSVSPMVLMFAAVYRKRREQHERSIPTFVFLTGYLIAWSGFSALVTAIQWPLHSHGLLTPMMENAHTLLAGGVLLAAGLYQLSPLKNACLSKCRSPLAFIMTEWREGARGALIMGIRHGLYCVGCCWVLMLILFAVGVMNVLWVLLLTAFVLLEKTAPNGIWISRASGMLLATWGIWVLI